MALKFIHDKPAVMIKKTMIISDIHIGIESSFYKKGIKIPSGTERMAGIIIDMIKKNKAKELVVLGDIKHKVPGSSFQEEREIPEFLNSLKKYCKITLILGNHDGEIADMGIDDIKTTKHLILDDSYLTHGHMWPDESFLQCKSMIIGHEHPQIEFRDELGYRHIQNVWVKAALEPEKIKERYKKARIKKKLPELIIMPFFNEFCGGIAMNKDNSNIKRTEGKPGLGPVARSADLKNGDIYLLDGTYLGKLKDI